VFGNNECIVRDKRAKRCVADVGSVALSCFVYSIRATSEA
jgi:hypothetical protein